MNEIVEKYIDKYQAHLDNGESNLKRLVITEQTDTEAFRQQKTINALWKIFIQDLHNLADQLGHDPKKKRY